MASRSASKNLVIVLILALLLAWVGHSLAAIKAPPIPGDYSGAVSHGHSHDVDEPAFPGHKHAPDHAHEVPNLGAPLTLQPRSKQDTPPSSLRATVPDGPIYLIERPPRSGFVF
jgi:hypothetical protein